VVVGVVVVVVGVAVVVVSVEVAVVVPVGHCCCPAGSHARTDARYAEVS
jgi:hypothetical protein